MTSGNRQRWTDARGVTLEPNHRPQRIVSLVPSTTETLCALGLADRLVGITRYCVHPAEQLSNVQRVGGTKQVNIDLIRQLHPDLIFGNCEENTKEIFDALSPIAPLWCPLPKTVDDAIHDLHAVGALIHSEDLAAQWVHRIKAARDAVRNPVNPSTTFTYAWLIWRRPWMACGGDTFTTQMLAEFGGRNVFDAHTDRFPTISAADLSEASPDLIFLSSEPFPFVAKHLSELSEATGLPTSTFRFVDGSLGTWHGVRMLEAFHRWPDWSTAPTHHA